MKTILSLFAFLVFSGNVLFGQVIVNLTPINATCNGMCNGAINMNASGGTPPYTYLWSNSMVIQNPNGLCAGTYTVTVTDNIGTTGTGTATIAQPAILTASVLSQTNVSCNGMCDGTATITNSGGTPPYTYFWSPTGGNSTVATNLCAGVYTVTITDANACTSVMNVTITQPAALTATASNTGPYCEGQNINLTASGGYISYAWSGPIGYNSTLQNPTISGATLAMAGVFSVTVTNAVGCTAVATTTVIVNSTPTINAGADQTVCANSYVSLSGSVSGSSTTGIWTSNGTGTFIPDNTTLNATYISSAGDIMSGTVVLTLTSTNNGSCNAVTDQMVITIMPAPTPYITGALSYCAGSSTMLNAGAGYISYSWSTSATTQTINVISAGNYSVTVTNANGCTGTTSVNITVNALPTVSAGIDQSVCSGTAVTLSGSGALTYVWNNSVTNGVSFIPLTTTTYSVTGTDANGCSNTDQVVVNVNTLPVPTISGAMSYCAGSSTYLDAGAGYITYNWSPSGNTQVINVTSAGNYSVTVTDANGCMGTNNVTITELYAILNGTVTYSGGFLPAGDGTVNLFKQSTSGGGQFDSIASQIITATGYQFNNLMPGNYHIGVTLTNPSAYPNLMNTYYNNHFLWTEADTITLACNDNITIPVLMYEFVSSPPGNCDLSGTIVYGNYSGFKSTQAVGEPVPGAEILIEQEPNDVPIQSAITDSNGDYLLTNIAEGFGYKLLVDIPGYPIMSTYFNLTINSTDTLLNNLNFLLDTSSGGGIFIDSFLGFSNPFINSGIISMNVFPNPFAKYINVNFELSQNIDVVIDLISITGKESKELLNKPNCQKGNYNYKVSVPQNYAEGNYLIKIQAGNNVIVKKLVLKK